MSSLNDEVLSTLIDHNISAVAVVSCTLKEGSWSGFLVCINPWVILTTSHAISEFRDEDLMRPQTYRVQFMDGVHLSAQQVAIYRAADLLLLSCESPREPTTMLTFTNLFSPRSMSIWSISHPHARFFRFCAGRTCSRIYAVRYPQHLFDHDCQLFQGSSGAPLMNSFGFVVGMQVGECLETFRVCVGRDQPANANENVVEPANAYGNPDVQRNEDVGAAVQQPVQPANVAANLAPLIFEHIKVHSCNLKMAIPTSCIETCIKELMFRDAPNRDLPLNEFIRVAVCNYLNSSGTAGSSSGTAGASSSGTSAKRART